MFERLKRVSVNGTSLAYCEQGTGDTVVFIHGSASDLRTWGEQVSMIGAQYRTVCYSRRYARPNDDIEDGVDDQMLPHVEDLVALLQSIDVSSAHLVGHSWGGFIALLTAIRHPEVVRSLVLMEPPVISLFVSTPPRLSELLHLFLHRPGTALEILKFGITALTPAQKAYRRGDEEAAMRAFGCGVLGRAGFERLSEARKQQVRDNRKADRAQIMGAGFPQLDTEDVRSVQVPTLLLVGEDSPALFHRLTDRLHDLLPRSKRVEIAEASHLMHEEGATMVNEAILAFLKRQTSGSQKSVFQDNL